MHRSVLCAYGALTFAASSASAAFTGVTVESLGEVVAGHTTLRFYANFDDPADALLAVSGDADVAALRFAADQPLYNDSPVVPGTQLEDILGPLNGLGDSWVTVGGMPNPEGVPGGFSCTEFSPNFLGGDGQVSVINGSFFEQLDDGGYFDSHPGTAEDGGSVLIAQFTLGNELSEFLFQGTVNYNSAGAGVTAEAFQIVLIPGPGIGAAFLVAGVCVASRRRRG